MIIIAPLAAAMLQLGVSRQREFLADATGARMLGSGKPLADALETLERGAQAVPMQVNPATESLYIVNPLSCEGRRQALLDAPAARRADQAPARVRRGAGHPLRLDRTEDLRRRRRTTGSVAPTQEALYAELDLDLSWSERELPERERTKHVHRLHPYLGKFIPQLVEVLLDALRADRAVACSTRSPARARRSSSRSRAGTTRSGGDIAAFNCLLMRVKTARYNEFVLEKELRDACRAGSSTSRGRSEPQATATSASGTRRGPLPSFSAWRSLVDEYEHADVMRVVLARAARSARLTTHFDLDFPRSAAARAVLVPQAPARVPPGRARRALPPPLRARHARADQGVRARPRHAARGARCCTATRGSSTGAGRSTPSSPRRPIRG